MKNQSSEISKAEILAEIELVKQLRSETDAGLMDCIQVLRQFN